MTMSRFVVFTNGWFLFSFLALLIVIPRGYAIIPLMVLGVILVSLPVMRHVSSRLDIRDLNFCLALFLYTAIWLLDVWQPGNWWIDNGIAMPLWPALAAMVLIWLRLFPPSAALWWAGLCTGSLLAGSIALFEYRVLMHDRVGNGMNSIPFGNLALLLGCLSLTASFWWLLKGRCARGKVWFALAAAAGGMMASLLSGTRGGWVAAPVLALLVWIAWQSMPDHEVRHWRRRNWLAVTLVLLIFVGVIVLGEPGSRLAAAVDQFQAYWLLDDRGGSVGLRFEMWKAGVVLFSQSPMMGWGDAGLQSARDALVAQGLLHPGVSQFTQLHSDVIDTAARRGLIGLVSLVAFYGVPLAMFWRCRKDPDPNVRLVAIAGVMIVTSFMVFGLSQSMLRDVRGLSGYLGLCVGCWAVLRSLEPTSHSPGHMVSG
ncbi:O-antigen ligase family protein [Halomonas rhizosphaerae]|uniref:O-antigen ligase family protein n=1 Tax=Halomonas rhizosphaerae TaxID=3043296 RepID=A0ABT6V0Y9_9GAMM|nr:O-antigen ligase family protein [Halomonas rhizosphaerae]MDI5891893.1 O-antigen ligase family protein [Halomonas rhizosphaerae]